MASIFVFSPDCDDFDSLGLCGPLTPAEDGARFVEEANGTSELTVRHPVDDMGRWSFLQEGYILEAEVPVRTTPEILSGAIVTSIEKWHVKDTATKGQRAVYSKSSGGRKLKTLDKGAEVFVVDKGSSRYKVKYKKGYGWISTGAIDYDLTYTGLASDPAAIESVVPAWSIRPQLFRIYSVDTQPDAVTVKARHISYDLLGNVTTYTADNPTCVAALGTSYGDSSGGILSNCCKPHEFVGRTNVADQRVTDGWTRVSPIEALLNPETGLTHLWGVDLVRDNWELTVLADAGLNRGVRIEHRKNLTGVQCSVDTSDLITSILPIGQTSKGKPLLLAAGSYTVNGKTVTIDSSLTVDSPREAAHAAPHVFTLDVGSAAKAGGTSSSDLLAARKKMIAAALAKFDDEQCDIPLLSLKVQFVSLGDTEEGKPYRELENIYLFDRVTVWHPKIGVDILAEVNRVEFDPTLERFVGIELGAVRRNASLIKVPSWQLPPATRISYGAVSSGALADDVGALIDMSANTTVQTTLVVVESAAGNVLRSQSTATGTTLSARVYRGGVEITGSLAAALFSWSRESGNSTADTAWAAAHVGVKSVSVTAAEFATAPATYHCDVADAE